MHFEELRLSHSKKNFSHALRHKHHVVCWASAYDIYNPSRSSQNLTSTASSNMRFGVNPSKQMGIAAHSNQV